MLPRGRLMLIAAVFTIFAVFLLVNHVRYQEQEAVYPPENLIRLHVVANSDSQEDQDLKREIRDEIVRFMAPQMLAVENIDSARLITMANLDNVKQIASREVNAWGKDYPVDVEMDSFAFPTKHYGPFVLPAGDYEALRVVVGSGGGANWWCVLFPPLCFVDMSKAVALSQAEQTKIVSAGSNYTAAEERAGGASLQSPGSEDGEPETPGETFTVEFRLKILDFFQNLK